MKKKQRMFQIAHLIHTVLPSPSHFHSEYGFKALNHNKQSSKVQTQHKISQADNQNKY